MTAKDMFKELGYECAKTYNCIQYKRGNIKIIFDKTDKTVRAIKYTDKLVIDFDDSFYMPTEEAYRCNGKEMLAICTQCKELGWKEN